MMRFANQTEHAFYDYMTANLKDSSAGHYIMRLRTIKPLDILVQKDLDPYIAACEAGSYKKVDGTSHGAYSAALKHFRHFQESRRTGDPDTMVLKDFIGKVVVRPDTKRRYFITGITSPEFRVQEIDPDINGYRKCYCYRTINGDPITNGYLAFEDTRLTEPFKRVFNAHSRSENGYWEEYDYWMRRD